VRLFALFTARLAEPVHNWKYSLWNALVSAWIDKHCSVRKAIIKGTAQPGNGGKELTLW
jgi:hypothetical protein